MGGKGVKKTTGKTALYIAAAAAALTLLAANWLAQAAERELQLRADMTLEQSTVLSGGTKSKLGALISDIYIYYVGSPGQDVITDSLLQSYDASSPSISYSVIGEDALPAAWKGAGASQGSVIVSDTAAIWSASGGRFDIFANEDLFADGTQSSKGNDFKGESAITPAIMRVAGGKIKRAVFLEGQGEARPCDMLLGDLDKLCFETLFTDAEAALDPAADTLIIISPKQDVSDEGYKNIKGFLDAGGSAAFLMDGVQGLVNFGALLADFGIRIDDEIILGGDPMWTYKSPLNILPHISSEGEALGLMGPSPVLNSARPITVTQSAATKVTPLLWSDESCFLKEPEGLSLEKPQGEIAGSYIVGALANRDGARIALVTSSSFAASGEDYSYRGNSGLLTGIVNILSGEAEERTDAPGGAYSIALTQSVGIKEPALLIAAAVLLPLAVIAAGLLRRRSRNKQ